MNSIKKVILKLWVRIVIIVVMIGIFTLGAFLIINELIFRTYKESIFSYDINRNCSYVVELWDNSFIKDQFLGMGKAYMSDLVKQIIINYDYDFMGSNMAQLSYNYDATATINGTYKINNSDSKVWSKSYNIINDSVDSLVDNKINFSDSIKIDFHFFDDEVANFRKQLKLPIDANLDILFKFNIYGIVDNEEFSDSTQYMVSVPLNQQVFNINKSILPDSSGNHNLYKLNYRKNFNIFNLVFGSVLCFISFILFLISYKFVFISNKSYPYFIKRNKILKEYKDIIVEVLMPISTLGFSIIDVLSFNEMIDLENDLKIPILFYQYKNLMKGDFVIITDKVIYRYVLEN